MMADSYTGKKLDIG